ncbi:bifunctional diguanylate cyclase/phosphodiesterase [Noviherbaspirillum galbum]|uniref:EAL domain-containing protein n=1 Tax=Noviherbaspirillum galbum TaxID=2709383 RepID=A0A6B3SQK9_9BURK|nr:EAL domain-containing protein [Noviherbaspirillum galbum]NEX61036.1 EAL domain-containing protein [Noviherbaspirillum galbum]
MHRTRERTMSQATTWPIRTLLTRLVLACLLPAIVGAILLFIYEYQDGLAQQRKNTIQTARAMALAVDNHLLKAQALAQTLSTSHNLAARNLAGFHEEARAAITLSGLGTNVVLRDAAGRQVLNTAIAFGGALPGQPDPEHVRGVFATARPTFSDVFISPVYKRPIMSVDVPVFLDGKVAYALGVGILPKDFNTLVKSQGLPEEWMAAVLDGTGTIAGRTHLPEKFVGEKANERLVHTLLSAAEGTVDATSREGIAVQTSFSRSAVTHWGVAIGIPHRLIQLDLLQTFSVLGLGASIVLLISLMLARSMSERIAHAVNALTGPALALGEGGAEPHPGARVKEVAQVAEVAEVAAAIDRAAALLQERADELAEAHRLGRFGTWHCDLATGELRISDSLKDILGQNIVSFATLRDTAFATGSWPQFEAAWHDAIRTGKSYDLEMQANHARGHPVWLNARGSPVRNDKGDVVAMQGMLQDITESKHAERLLSDSREKLRDAALHDFLTGLPNRGLVMEYCERLVAAARRGHGGGALLYIDIDRFKPINDLYGHDTGDRVLQEVAQRLRQSTRQEDLVGRLGGDEFVIVLPHADGVRHRAETVAQHVLANISRPMRLNALELTVSPSIGISFFPEHADTVSSLIHAADLAMYQAKQTGRSNYQFYTPELDRRIEQALSVEARLRDAIGSDGLELHYQPVIDLKNGKVVGAEALLRLTGAFLDMGPDRFIPIAESAGLIGRLGEWVAIQACQQHVQWLRQGMTMTIAINVSPLQFRQRSFIDRLSEIIADTGMDPRHLEIEVTESAIMENVEDAVRILTRLKALGVKVALDDFGTGYSSLSSLTSLPLDKLKVDQSFVRRIERDEASRTVTEAIIGLGRSLRLNVHGEGIESEDALLYLEEHGCNQAQGYWFSKPLRAAEFTRWYHEQWEKKTSTEGWERVRRIWDPKR